MNELQTAVEIAFKAHHGQKDKVGVDYIWHPITVATYCTGERAKITAILHDVVEDSDVTLDDLRKAGIGEDVIVAVGCLTKSADKAETVEQYYKRVASNKIATEVKLADIKHNSCLDRWGKDNQDKAIVNAKKYAERRELLLSLVTN